MTPETLSFAPGRLPDIHVWMTLGEAADALDTSLDTVSLRVREGDLESRLNEHGEQQVLVCLPKQPAGALTATDDWIDVLISSQFTGGRKSTSQSGPKEWKQDKSDRRATRSGKLAWAVAAVIAMGAGAGGYLAATTIVAQHQASQDLSRKMEMVSLAADDLKTQRDQLRSQLSDTSATLDKVQGELAVDRNVEDTLFKAVQAAHVAKRSDANPVFADSAH